MKTKFKIGTVILIATIAASAFIYIQMANATPLFADDFEKGFEPWNTQDQPQITSLYAHHGNHSLYVDSMHEYVWNRDFDTAKLNLRFYMMLPTTPTGSLPLEPFQIRSKNHTNLVVGEYDSGAWTIYYRNGSVGYQPSQSVAYPIELWKWIEVEVSLDVANGAITFYIEDVQVLKIENVSNTQFGNIWYFMVGSTYGGTSLREAYFDCVVASTLHIGMEEETKPPEPPQPPSNNTDQMVKVNEFIAWLKNQQNSSKWSEYLDEMKEKWMRETP